MFIGVCIVEALFLIFFFIRSCCAYFKMLMSFYCMDSSFLCKQVIYFCASYISIDKSDKVIEGTTDLD